MLNDSGTVLLSAHFPILISIESDKGTDFRTAQDAVRVDITGCEVISCTSALRRSNEE